jgi:ubiquinone/menaquinone biosynthesis C-methylase UbiE
MTVTATVDRSYQLGTFRDNADSLRRLKDQAAIVLDLEFEQLRAAGLGSRGRVMDLGCGPGIVSAELGSRTEASRLLAIDCNEISLEETRRQIEKRQVRNARVKAGNIYADLPVEGEKFDFVYSRLVFQHLSDPIKAMVNVRKHLAPGGRFCICDVDDRWLTVIPEVPELGLLLRRVARAQAARGGDRNVGTKLAHYLERAGFVEIRSTALLVSTDLIGSKAFCDLVFGYKLEVIPDGDVQLARDELRSVEESLYSPGGWAGVAVFFVSGAVKPED